MVATYKYKIFLYYNSIEEALKIFEMQNEFVFTLHAHQRRNAAKNKSIILIVWVKYKSKEKKIQWECESQRSL